MLPAPEVSTIAGQQKVFRLPSQGCRSEMEEWSSYRVEIQPKFYAKLLHSAYFRPLGKEYKYYISLVPSRMTLLGCEHPNAAQYHP